MRIPAGLKKFHVRPATEICFHGVESPGDLSHEQENGKDDRAEHQHRLDDIGPNDSFDSADGGVDRCDDGDKKNAPDVGIQIHWQRGKEITPDYNHDGAAEIKADADAEDAREKKNAAGRVFRLGAEADSQKFINALHSVIVVRLDEGEGDDDTRKHCANGELAVKIAARFEAFRRRSEESGCACFGGDNGREHGPPRNGTRA